MLIDDLLVLGRACPEPLKDGRTTVCLGGHSPTHGFIRLYPTRYNMSFKKWDIITVEVERDHRDTRKESWKIKGAKKDWIHLADMVEKVGRIENREKRRNIVDELTDVCVEDINQAQRSLGIVKPEVFLEKYFAKNPTHHKSFQQGLPLFTEHEHVELKRDYTHEPRLKYRCPQCKTKRQFHDQVVLEWGFYEWMRKNPDKRDQVWDNAKFNRNDYDIYLFVGNQANQRTSFIIIETLAIKSGAITRSLFNTTKVSPDFEQETSQFTPEN